ncbi:MAG: Uracil glycosylase superfamily protein [Verrucomicrobiales bacterium]|nr:Uracil glycosylase superfamily protein [Verrucomicrobiales bacterium]
MSGAYSEFLEATIQHLESLKRGGRRYVEVSRETLELLTAKPGRPPLPVSAPRVAPSVPPQVAKTVTPAPLPVATIAPIPPLASRSKEVEMAELEARAKTCVKCPNLANSRRNVVFGVGDINASLMFVGEAPGMEEDEQGEPFVGRAGQLLTKIIQTMGLDRQSVYIANILKCRPDTPAQTTGNRKPKPEEMQNCTPYLNAQIDLIKPKVIVALGGSAVEGLFGNAPVRITQLRGQYTQFRGIPVMQTYHPSYLLRPNPVNVKRQVWEDMLQVLEKLGLPISEKQRGFFLAKS